MTTIAYLITTHRDVARVARLVRAIQDGDPEARVYISHDRAGAPGMEAMASHDRVRVRLAEGGRGDHTQIDRILELGRDVAADGGADYVVLLSGEDYPCRPLSELKELLVQSGDGFLHRFPVLDNASEWSIREGRLRYLYRWTRGPRISAQWSRALHLLHGLSYLQPFFAIHVGYGRLRVGYRQRASPPVALFGGSAWCALSWRAFQYTMQVAAERPALRRWMRESIAVDEAFFQSVLAERPDFTFAERSYRYFRFTETAFGHPAYLTAADHASIQESGDLFARKVRCPELMDLLDRDCRATRIPFSGGHQ